jgi:CRP/FNR family cyclic AMP-dependent transcriptional regulator
MRLLTPLGKLAQRATLVHRGELRNTRARCAHAILRGEDEQANGEARPRHCKPDALLRHVRTVVGETNMGLARLGESERDALSSYAARASWPSGFAIYQRGAVADGVFVVARGRVVLRSRVRAGRSFVPWIATAGETFGSEGLSQNARYATDARADDESETFYLSSARFRAFVREQPQRSLTLITQLMAERAALLDKLRELTTLSVEQRLVATLVRMASNNTFAHDDGQIVLCAARYRLLCEMVGATRESVSLVLGRLVGDGLVERRGTSLVIVAPAQLADRLDIVTADNELAFPALDTGQEQALQ